MEPENNWASWVTKPMRLAQAIDFHLILRNSVVVDVAGLRAVEAYEQLDQGGFAGAGGTDEGDGLAAGHAERNVLESGVRSGLVFEADVPEFERIELMDGDGIIRTRFRLHRQNRFEFLEGNLGFAIGVDDVAQFLQRPEDEERIDEESEVTRRR